jgi:hypothetical protein
LIKKIQVEKKINRCISFDTALRNTDFAAPKEVKFVPEPKVKINLNTAKKKPTKEDLHKRFMRNDSDDSFDLEDIDVKS